MKREVICNDQERLVEILGTGEAVKGGLCSIERGFIDVQNRRKNAVIGGELKGILRSDM